MPQLIDRIPLDNNFLDARFKLLPCQRERMPHMYSLGYSQRQLARMYGVSRRLISFLVDPEKEERNKARYRENQKNGKYYNREKHRAYMQKHRQRKKAILLKQTLDI